MQAIDNYVKSYGYQSIITIPEHMRLPSFRPGSFFLILSCVSLFGAFTSSLLCQLLGLFHLRIIGFQIAIPFF